MIHRGEKPFQCNICFKKLREKSNYNFHMKKHFLKINKKVKVNENKNENKIKNNFRADELIIDKNINNVGLNKNIEFPKTINNNLANNNLTNNSEHNNHNFDFNDNNDLMNKINESMRKFKNFNNNKFNNFNFDYQIDNQINKFDLNIPQENIQKDEINQSSFKNLYLNNQNIIINNEHKIENQLNEDLIIPNIKGEKYKIENNYNNPDLTENLYIINNYNQNDLFNENNSHFGDGVENKFSYNYFQQNFASSLNFENYFH